jgi:hypothetical protein
MMGFDPEVAIANLSNDRDRLAEIVQTEVAQFLATTKPTPPCRLRIVVRVGPRQVRVRLPTPSPVERPLQQEPVLWKAIFIAFYGRPPEGDDDPDWGKLFDPKVYAAMSFLPEKSDVKDLQKAPVGTAPFLISAGPFARRVVVRFLRSQSVRLPCE